MDNLINQIEVIPLSGEDLMMMCVKMGNSHTKWMLYDDLKNVRDIDTLYPSEGESGHVNSIFFLLQIRNDGPVAEVGHWIVLIKNKPEKGERESMAQYTYMDPYGLKIEEDLVATGEPPYLINLLRGRKVDINVFKYQKFRSEVQTCGRHVANRAVYHFMDNKSFDKFIITPIERMVNDLDTYVILVTMFLAKSDEVVRMFFKEKVLPGSNIGHGLIFSRIGKGGSVI